MTMFQQGNSTPLEYGYAETGERTGLVTQFFHTVYLWMAIGLVWTALVSWASWHTAPLRAMMSPGLMIGAAIGAFVLSLVTQRVALRTNVVVGLLLFMLYATLIGFIIAPIWHTYGYNTIGTAFVLTGGIFAVMSLVGFVTKMDLSKIGAVCIMIVIGLFAASIINFFVASDMVSWIITYAVVIVFPVLVAVETKALKDFAIEAGDSSMASRMAVVGALTLYISFINIFLALLRILGSRE